ncbi:hypothetical protein PBCVMA1E_149R [Paramecium bursaria Chlorella virus MA1E]|nr:hypothetical protein PBCVMA1E_149R [Paramecium bursaria Chlorella virus MA1E]
MRGSHGIPRNFASGTPDPPSGDSQSPGNPYSQGCTG